jgi:spore maturation protein CgeB
MKGTKVLYFPDNLDRFGDLFNKYEQHYDFIFFTHGNDKIGKSRYYHLPLAYDPYIHFPLDRKKTIDVAFVGTNHKDRAHIAKIPGIKMYGNDWGNGIYPVYSAKKRSVYAQTKIMVNHHVRGDTSANMRDYEALAMKTFLLSDLIPNDLEGGMVQYHGQKHLQSQIVYYLKHEEEREAIAAKGYELVQPHTYEKRVEALIEVVT